MMSKKRPVPYEDSDSSDSEQEVNLQPKSELVDDDDSDDEGVEVINMDFDFYDPKEIDFKSVRNFVSKLLPDQDDFDPSDIADMYVNQPEVGSSVKPDGDDDCYAYISAFGFEKHEKVEGMKFIKDFLLSKCPAPQKASFRELLEHPKLAWMHSSRMINMPAELAPALYQNFIEDVKWASSEKSTAKDFDFKYYLLISPCFILDAGEAQSAEPAKKKRKKSKKQKKAEEEANAMFYRFEEQLILEEAEIAFSFNIKHTEDQALAGVPRELRHAIIVSAKKLPALQKKMATLLSQ
eukprot:TRINITY_DN13876_c0_g1_i1.p1 TRINITY_DN13876_c0_g1~~TRINITY_DN13876_c0_g1_i1.p1  ORF type:complete len:294 (+),score=103.68 TRINITY_DN13876_c0_g1_i1:31-912(+)